MGAPQHEFEQRASNGGLLPARWELEHQRNLGGLGATAYQQENNMLKEALAYLTSLGDPMFRDEDDGRVYSSRPVTPVQKPLVDPIRVQTLSGLRDLYRMHEQTETPLMIHIQDYSTVFLIAKKLDQWSRRPTAVIAQLPSDVPKFRFGQWLDPEEFVIGLMTLFENADYAFGDIRKVLKLVNSLAAEAVTLSNDDGVSQQVITRQGMVRKDEEKVTPRVSLAPYRTFREVSQPMSEFVLRLRSRQGQMPSCALFEGDGGNWRNDAVRNIREYFAKELPAADIVA